MPRHEDAFRLRDIALPAFAPEHRQRGRPERRHPGPGAARPRPGGQRRAGRTRRGAARPRQPARVVARGGAGGQARRAPRAHRGRAGGRGGDGRRSPGTHADGVRGRGGRHGDGLERLSAGPSGLPHRRGAGPPSRPGDVHVGREPPNGGLRRAGAGRCAHRRHGPGVVGLLARCGDGAHGRARGAGRARPHRWSRTDPRHAGPDPGALRDLGAPANPRLGRQRGGRHLRGPDPSDHPAAPLGRADRRVRGHDLPRLRAGGLLGDPALLPRRLGDGPLRQERRRGHGGAAHRCRGAAPAAEPGPDRLHPPRSPA